MQWLADRRNPVMPPQLVEKTYQLELHAPIPVGKGNQASIEILFSGRVDSIVLAALYHDHVPLDQPIDLINVELQLSIPHWNCLSIE